jgi:hypothetical protein
MKAKVTTLFNTGYKLFLNTLNIIKLETIDILSQVYFGMHIDATCMPVKLNKRNPPLVQSSDTLGLVWSIDHT